MDNKKEIERKKVHNTIWKIADDLRGNGNIDGWEFQQYVLVTLFYRFISENIQKYVNDQEGDSGLDYALMTDEQEEANPYIRQALIEEKGFFIKPSQLFCNVLKNAEQDTNLNETLEKIFNSIEASAQGQQSEEDIKGLFRDFNVNEVRLGTNVKERNAKLAKILKTIGDLDLGNYQDNTIDLFGDAYEFLMSMYAANAGKSSGEYFTPQEVSELLVRLTLIDFNNPGKGNKKNIRTVYDPCCGSGSLLLKYAKILKENKDQIVFSGQEINLTTYNLARINMFLHDVNYSNFHIRLGNTLLDPKHEEEKPFDAIVSNPPYSIKWDGEDNPLLSQDARFCTTRLAPKSKADLAFVLHMIHYLSSSGTAAIVEFPGTLYRGGAEEEIRKYLVQNINVVDTIIQLPDNLFFGTSIATCILILRKNKQDTNIFFVDASKEFIKQGKQNKLTEENIKKIVETIEFKKEIPHFSKLVSQKEVEDKKFNLSVNTYVEKEDTTEKVDIKVLNKNINETVTRIDILRKEIDQIISQLEGTDE